MCDVTRNLIAIECGDTSRAEILLLLAYDELRRLAAARLANEKPGHTMQTTALVHEAYLSKINFIQYSPVGDVLLRPLAEGHSSP